MSKYEFEAEAKRCKSGEEIGAWTDGIGIFSDICWPGELKPIPGKTYKVTVEEVDSDD